MDIGEKIAVGGALPGQVHHIHVITELSEFTEYKVKVTAYNNAGEGPASNPQIAKTHEGGKQARLSYFDPEMQFQGA